MSSALVVMDVQNGIVERVGDRAEELLAAVAGAVAAAREAGVPVLFVRVAFREGTPEVSANNRAFSALSSSSSMGEAHPATQVHPAVEPAPGEVVVTKRRVSAFAGSDLDVVLRAQGVDHLVLCGIATSGVVLSTVRQAADLDFALTVLADACADADPEVHRVLLEKVFPRQAEVTTTAAWAAGLARPGGAESAPVG